MTAETLYEERDGIAVITLNRPEKKNALTDAVIDGVASGIEAATASAAVSAIVLRGAGDSLTAGYDLSAVDVFSGPTEPDGWTSPYDAPGQDQATGTRSATTSS